MIPKKIHYVWIGGPKGNIENICINSWKEKLPEYEICEWNENNIDIGVSMIKDIVSVSAGVLAGAITYGILIIILKVEELDLIFNMINKGKNKLLKK